MQRMGMGISCQRVVVVSWVTSMIIFFSPFSVFLLETQKAQLLFPKGKNGWALDMVCGGFWGLYPKGEN